MRRLGGRRVKGPECDVIRTGLARFHREVAAVVTGLADLGGRSQHGPRLLDIAVALSEVDAVRAEAPCKRDAVVDDERNVRVSADRLKRLCQACELMLVDVFDAKLECGRDAGLQGLFQPVREATADLLRADQVELGRLRPLARREVDRVEFGVGQASTFVVEAP